MKFPFNQMSTKRCDRCGKYLKLNLILRKPKAHICYSCSQKLKKERQARLQRACRNSQIHNNEVLMNPNQNNKSARKRQYPITLDREEMEKLTPESAKRLDPIFQALLKRIYPNLFEATNEPNIN